MVERYFTQNRARRELKDLEKKEPVPYRKLMTSYNKGLLMWAQIFLKGDNCVQKRIQRIKRTAKELSRKLERESEEKRIRHRLSLLEQQQITSYEKLMNENRGLFKWATRYMAHDPNTQQRIKAVKRRAKLVSREAKREVKKEETKRELLDLEQKELVSYESLMDEKREFLKWAIKNLKDNESQERIARIKKRAKSVSLNVRRGIKQDGLMEELSELEYQEISYEELMRNPNKSLIMLAEKYLREDKETQERIKRIKREALKISIRKVASNGSLYHLQVRSKFSYLEKASREVYEKEDGKIALQMLAEDAGIVYFQKYKQRNLKQLLEDITSFEIGDEDKSHGRKQGIRKVILKRFGHHGKALILAGFDYLARRIGGIQKQDYVFSQEELALIAADTSLNEEEKARCIFNALSFQYYEFPDGCRVVRTSIDLASRPNILQYQVYSDARLGIIQEPRNENVDSIVGIYLRRNIPNESHATNFEFSGKKGETTGRVFYKKLENLLRFLNEENEIFQKH